MGRLGLLLARSGVPAWRRLIDRPLASDERISLITDIFSDHDETEEVKLLHGEDAQAFVDIIDEVFPHEYFVKTDPLNHDPSYLPSRCPMDWNLGSAGGA